MVVDTLDNGPADTNTFRVAVGKILGEYSARKVKLPLPTVSVYAT